MHQATLITFIGYLIFMMLVGFWAYRRTKNSSDYMLGGRTLNSGVTALSAGASDMSGWILMGLPGAIYASGVSQAWILVGLVIGAYLNWKLVAARLRYYTELAADSLTLPDYFANRFHENGRSLRLSAMLVMLIFYGFYIASGLVAGATLFEKGFNLDFTQALLIGSAVVVSYTFLGGFLAVSWTDFFQGILMVTALVVAPIVLVVEFNGLGNLIDRVEFVNKDAVSWTKDLTLIGFISLQAWGLGYFGQPHILARFMAADAVHTIPSARRISMSWMLVSTLGAIFVGFAGIAFFADKPSDLALLAQNNEKVFILLTQVLFNPWLAGFLLAAILAAVMSTVDSQLLAVASSVTEDFYKPIVKPDASEKSLVWVNRFIVLSVAGIALFIAADPNNRVLSLVAQAWAGFGAAFGPVVILSLFWKKMTQAGALAGIITGATVVLIWDYLGDVYPDTIFASLYELLPGFVAAWLAVMVVSMFSKVKVEVASQFDWYQSEFKKMVS